MMQRATLTFCMVVAACRCPPPPPLVVEQTLRAREDLDLGRVPIGQSVAEALIVTNASRVPVTVSVMVEPPFFVASRELTIGAGADLALAVRFVPTKEGRYGQPLALGDRLVVQLRGEAQPPCPTVGPCHRVRFDAPTRTCIDEAQPNDTPCADLCVMNGVCQEGACAGTSPACDDHNPCTIDACSHDDGGCLHIERLCPVTDACRTAACEPSVGCIEHEVDEGTACGPADCATARVCLAGTCRSAVRPQPAGECEYTALASDTFGAMTCAANRVGHVRCWSATKTPHTLAQVSNVGRLFPNHFGIYTATAEGWLNGYITSRDAGVPKLGAPVVDLADTCALLSNGQFVCWDLGGGITLIRDGGVSGFGRSFVSPSPPSVARLGTRAWCHQDFDGGLDCSLVDAVGAWAPIASPPFERPQRLAPILDSLCSVENGGLMCATPFRLDGGHEVAWQGPFALDAGSVTGGTLTYSGFAQPATAWSATGPTLSSLDGEWTTGLSAPVRAITQTIRLNPRAACALTATNEVWCWGDDSTGGLGQGSALPDGPKELSLPAPAQQVAVGTTTVVVADGQLWQAGDTIRQGVDGPASPSDSGVGLLGSVGEVSSLALLDHEYVCGVSNGRAWVLARGLRDLGAATAVAEWGDSIGTLTTEGELATFTPPDFVGETIAANVVAISDGCALFRDGGVGCAQRLEALAKRAPVAVPFLEPALEVSGLLSAWHYPGSACARFAGDRVRCWKPEMTDAGVVETAPYDILGLSRGIRQIVGGLSRGCALVGSNLVQCWGDNARFDGESTGTTAVSMPFAERVLRLVFAERHGCALLTSGRVQCWGINDSAQLGVWPTVTNTPVRMTR